MVILLVILARLTGSLQFVEWFALDYMMRSRPPEGTDDRILIVGINEADIQRIGTYPIPDRDLAALINQLKRHQPSVIGLDIVRNLAVPPGHQTLVTTFQQTPNLIGIEKILPDTRGSTVPPPPSLPEDQVGFFDALPDEDGYLRRSLLGATDLNNQYKFSFTLRLAAAYLSRLDIAINNGIVDPEAMRFDQVELTRVLPNSGGYVQADSGGNQILINFRSGLKPFRVVSLSQVLQNQVPDDWIRDRIVLIGITAPSAADFINSAAIHGSTPGTIYGVEIQAHAISQIVSAVQDGRSLLRVWGDGWEYGWIIGWGLLGISIGRIVRSPIKIILGIVIASMALLTVCYGLLLLGWWVPVVPALLVLILNGAGLTGALFYRHTQDLKSKIQDRQFLIDRTFDAIHNGPLQTLAILLRQTQEQTLTSQQLRPELEHLNQELRAVYEFMKRDTLSQSNGLYLDGGLELSLETPMHELLYEVYNSTLSRDLPCFQAIKLKVTTFEALESYALNPEQKRGLCRFLEEALCNVGKHAVGTTRLDVICKQEQGKNIVRVIDNGLGLAMVESGVDRNSQLKGRGTQQAKDLARRLGGRFQRSPIEPQGTLCEITWRSVRPWFWRL